MPQRSQRGHQGPPHRQAAIDPPLQPQQEIQTVQHIEQRLTQEAIPLPTPDTLRAYSEMLPEAPQLFLRMMEEQNAHRIATEQKVRDANIQAMQDNIALQKIQMSAVIDLQKRQTWMAFILAMLLMASFVIVGIVTKNGYAGAGGLVVSVGSVITAFLVNSRRSQPIQQQG